MITYRECFSLARPAIVVFVEGIKSGLIVYSHISHEYQYFEYPHENATINFRSEPRYRTYTLLTMKNTLEN